MPVPCLECATSTPLHPEPERSEALKLSRQESIREIKLEPFDEMVMPELFPFRRTGIDDPVGLEQDVVPWFDGRPPSSVMSIPGAKGRHERARRSSNRLTP
jgi:hypothetical protein